MTAGVRDALGRFYGSGKVTRRERDEWGVTVSIRNQRTGELRGMHEPGLRLEALRVIAERLDRSSEDWRVVCYSTPTTILSDMSGHRGFLRSDDTVITKQSPESVALSTIGRLDLLDPVIPMYNPRKRRRRR